MDKIRSSEITPEHIYLTRRQFMVGLGALAAGLALGACAGTLTSSPGGGTPAPTPSAGPDTPLPQSGATADELGGALTSYERVTGYNNYYEFSLNKSGVAAAARGLRTSPWEVAVGGLVRNPRTWGLEDLLALGQEERVYRLRCVETWSMVIPWVGFPLRSLLELAEPTAAARYVRFETLLAPEQMPGQKAAVLDWPYVEGLRLDEARHPLTILAVGLYGKTLLNQNGAPIRLVVPWKYGFKSIKSVVRIQFVEKQPPTSWNLSAPQEYGFYSNVNPQVDHPRWSQARERRIGEFFRRPTLMFNGYGDQVASLYGGMDLKKSY